MSVETDLSSFRQDPEIHGADFGKTYGSTADVIPNPDLRDTVDALFARYDVEEILAAEREAAVLEANGSHVPLAEELGFYGLVHTVELPAAAEDSAKGPAVSA